MSPPSPEGAAGVTIPAASAPGAEAPPGPRRRYGRRVATILAVAVAVLLVAELGVRAVASRLPQPEVFYDPVAQAKDAQLARVDKAGGADVVVTGPSSTLFGVDPIELGQQLSTPGSPIDVYNAGITAGVPPITADWLERFVLPRTRPRLVVWVLSTVDLNDAHKLDAVDSYFSSLAARDDIWARMDKRVSRVSDLFRYRRELRSPKTWVTALRGRPGEVELWNARLTPEGLATYEQLRLDEVARQQLLSEVEPFHMGAASTDLVVREIERMRARGIRVVLAEAPIPNRAAVLHPHGTNDVTAFQRRLRTIGSRTGASVIELPQELRADSLYQDYTHLNREGAARYTDLLAAGLR